MYRRLRQRLLDEEAAAEESKFEVGEEQKQSLAQLDQSDARSKESNNNNSITDWERKLAQQDAEAEERRLRIEKVRYHFLFLFFLISFVLSS